MIQPSEILSETAIEPVNALRQYNHELDRIGFEIELLESLDDTNYRHALDLSTQIKEIMSSVESHKKQWIEAPKRFINEVNLVVKDVEKVSDSMQEQLEQMLCEYHETLDDQNPHPSGSHMALCFPSKAKPVLSSATASAVFSEKPDFRVMDETMIPREFLVVDEAKIKKAIALGVQHIDGIQITQKKTITIRKK